MFELIACAFAGILCEIAERPPEPVVAKPTAVEHAVVEHKQVSHKRVDVQAVATWPEDCPVIPPTEELKLIVVQSVHGSTITPCEVAAQIRAESNWNPKAVSPAGAKGIAQFMDATAGQYYIDVWDARSSIFGLVKYMEWTRERWKFPYHERKREDIPKLGLGTYNYGLGNMYGVQRETGAVTYQQFEPDLPAETQNYVKKIEAFLEGEPWPPAHPEAR